MSDSTYNDITDEELAEIEASEETCWTDTNRLIAALRASRKALADTQRDLVDARHDLNRARMDAAKRLVDYRVSREEVERLRDQYEELCLTITEG